MPAKLKRGVALGATGVGLVIVLAGLIDLNLPGIVIGLGIFVIAAVVAHDIGALKFERRRPHTH